MAESPPIEFPVFHGGGGQGIWATARTSDGMSTMLSSCRRFSDSMIVLISVSVSLSDLVSVLVH